MNPELETKDSSLVSIVIITHRRLKLLREALDSAISQDHPRLEIVVVDDAGEAEVAKLVADRSRVDQAVRYVNRLVHLERGGGQQSRNLGLRESRGEFVLFLDDDDLLEPTCISGRVRDLLSDPEADACVGQCALFTETPTSGNPLWRDWTSDQDDLEMFLSNRVPWQTSGPLWRRQALVSVGEWDESLGSGQDYEFHIRALARGIKFARRPIVDYHWRTPRPDSYSGLDAFKVQHKKGYHIDAMQRGMAEIDRNAAWTPQRRNAAWCECIRLAALCRLNGGSNRTAQRLLSQARRSDCAPFVELLQVRLAIAAWFKLAHKIPALTYLNRCGLLHSHQAGDK